MSITDSFKPRYQALFPDEKRKAEAFDKIARLYYQQNFATRSGRLTGHSKRLRRQTEILVAY